MAVLYSTGLFLYEVHSSNPGLQNWTHLFVTDVAAVGIGKKK